MGDIFYDRWDQRIGREAADVLNRRSKTARILVGFIVGSVLISTRLSGAAYAGAEGALLVATITSYIYLMLRFNRELATALSTHLGFEVNPRNLPQFWSVNRFDAWLRAKKAGTPPRERSFLGGFVKIQLPPK